MRVQHLKFRFFFFWDPPCITSDISNILGYNAFVKILHIQERGEKAVLSNFHRRWSFSSFTVQILPIEQSIYSRDAWMWNSLRMWMHNDKHKRLKQRLIIPGTNRSLTGRISGFLGSRKFKILLKSDFWGPYKAFDFSVCFSTQFFIRPSTTTKCCSGGKNQPCLKRLNNRFVLSSDGENVFF